MLIRNVGHILRNSIQYILLLPIIVIFAFIVDYLLAQLHSPFMIFTLQNFTLILDQFKMIKILKKGNNIYENLI